MGRIILIVVCVLACWLSTGCGERVEIADPNLDLHLSGNWNDADSREVAAAIAPQCLSAGWIDAFRDRQARAPVIRIGHIRVRVEDLDDEIDTEIFTDDLSRALIGSGRVKAVASRHEAELGEGARDTRREMAEHASAASHPLDRQELAADYLLAGSILTQNDDVLDSGVVSGTYRRVKFYQVTLTLTDLITNEKVWSGSCERKKLVEQSTVGW